MGKRLRSWRKWGESQDFWGFSRRPTETQTSGEPRGIGWVRGRAGSGSPVSCRKSTSVIPQVSTVCPVRTRTPGLRSAHGAISSAWGPTRKKRLEGRALQGREGPRPPADWWIWGWAGPDWVGEAAYWMAAAAEGGPRANRCLKRLGAGPARAQLVTPPTPAPTSQVTFGESRGAGASLDPAPLGSHPALPNPTALRMRTVPWALPCSRCFV